MFIFSSPKPGRLSLEILEDLGTKIIQLWNVYPLWNLNELDIFWIILAPNKTFFCSQTVLTWKQMWCFENHHKSEPYSERQILRLMSYQKINFNPSQNLVCWDRINMVKLIYLTWINTTTITQQLFQIQIRPPRNADQTPQRWVPWHVPGSSWKLTFTDIH